MVFGVLVFLRAASVFVLPANKIFNWSQSGFTESAIQWNPQDSVLNPLRNYQVADHPADDQTLIVVKVLP